MINSEKVTKKAITCLNLNQLFKVFVYQLLHGFHDFYSNILEKEILQNMLLWRFTLFENPATSTSEDSPKERLVHTQGPSDPCALVIIMPRYKPKNLLS